MYSLGADIAASTRALHAFLRSSNFVARDDAGCADGCDSGGGGVRSMDSCCLVSRTVALEVNGCRGTSADLLRCFTNGLARPMDSTKGKNGGGRGFPLRSFLCLPRRGVWRFGALGDWWSGVVVGDVVCGDIGGFGLPNSHQSSKFVTSVESRVLILHVFSLLVPVLLQIIHNAFDWPQK